MRINFKHIEIHNFKSFADEKFDFEEHNGLNLICGKNFDLNDGHNSSNGSGKSTLISSLVFALFGETQNNSRNCNIANKWLPDKEVRVVVYFEVDNKSYKVASGFNKRGGQYCELYQVENDAEVSLAKSTLIETRQFLETEILNCDKSIFMRTILLSSDQNYNFFLLKKSEKKEFIEKLFDISVFGEMYDSIHHDSNKIDKALTIQQNKLLSINKNKDDYQSRSNAFEQSKQEKIAQIHLQLKDIDKKLNDSKAQTVESNSADIKKYTDYLDKANSALQKISEKQSTIIQSKHSAEISLNTAKITKHTKQNNAAQHQQILELVCSDCADKIKKHYDIQNLDSDVKYYDDIIESQSKIIETSIANSKTLDKKRLECENKISKINQKLKELTFEQSSNSTLVARLEATKTHIEQDLVKAENQENPYLELLNENSVELQDSTNELKKIETKYRYLKYAESIVSQETLRKFIIKDLVGLLNNKIKTYLTKFGAKYEVIFDEDMNYKLIHGNNDFDYCDFSGGEKSRLMIAACFAFRDFMYVRNNFSSNILFLDEFIDGAIDALAMENILNMLAEYCKQYNQNVFIISHRKSEIDNTTFDHIIQIVKKDHISTIKYLE